jgi:hypothetical protein
MLFSSKTGGKRCEAGEFRSARKSIATRFLHSTRFTHDAEPFVNFHASQALATTSHIATEEF